MLTINMTDDETGQGNCSCKDLYTAYHSCSLDRTGARVREGGGVGREREGGGV